MRGKAQGPVKLQLNSSTEPTKWGRGPMEAATKVKPKPKTMEPVLEVGWFRGKTKWEGSEKPEPGAVLARTSGGQVWAFSHIIYLPVVPRHWIMRTSILQCPVAEERAGQGMKGVFSNRGSSETSTWAWTQTGWSFIQAVIHLHILVFNF